MAYRVFLVDDHPFIREGVAGYLNNQPDLTVCGVAGEAGEAVSGIEQTHPDLVLLDLKLDGSSGLDLLMDLHARWPDLPVLVLSTYEEARYGERVIRMGARGYIEKNRAPETVLRAIRAVLRGELYVSKQTVDTLLRGQTRSVTELLTEREFVLFTLLGESKSPAEIAHIVNRAEQTVQNQILSIKKKLNFASRQELYQFAREWALGRESDAGA